MPTTTELRVLQALRKLGEGDRIAVASEIGLGSEMADYLCRYLSTKGLVRKVGRARGRTRYVLTLEGLTIVE
ncbi:hypothetical protein MYX84_04060 [Acidobacteria bacterium AH-259-O06]|nr:hypothetical protein [Acidobacteria bacterium AH-259-O06]